MAGSLTRPVEKVNLFIPSIAFMLFNGLLWYLNSVSLYFAKQSSIYLAAGLEGMLDANELYIFDGIALIFAAMLVSSSALEWGPYPLLKRLSK